MLPIRAEVQFEGIGFRPPEESFPQRPYSTDSVLIGTARMLVLSCLHGIRGIRTY